MSSEKRLMLDQTIETFPWGSAMSLISDTTFKYENSLNMHLGRLY